MNPVLEQGIFIIDSCKNITLLRNNLRGIYFHADTILNIEDNSFQGCRNNHVGQKYGDGYWTVRVIDFYNCNEFLLKNNNYSFDGGAYGSSCLRVFSSSRGTITNDSLDYYTAESWGVAKEMLYI